MLNGDKRYLGDVFINEENTERQKQFFRDIIESYQWRYGGNFDAATLQEKTADDFATRDQGEKADRAILSPLFLGRTPIANTEDYQYILSDAIRLDHENECIDAISWYRDLENDDLSDALCSIYHEVIALMETKLDTATFNDFIDNDYNELKENLDGAFVTFINENNQEVTKLNSDLTNGLRFILITQRDYDNLEENVKKYWRNIFIIRDPDDIPPDYTDPMTWPLENGYDFRVHDGYLQCHNGVNDQWKNICTLQELLEGSNVNTLIQNFIENQTYVLNEDAFLDSVQNLSQSDINENWRQYPFLSSSLHDDFIEKVLINGQSANVQESINPTTNFKTVNLDLNTLMNAKVDPLVTNINSTIATEQAKLRTAESTIGSIQNEIRDITVKNTNQDSELTRISQLLEGIQRDITSIDDKINTLNNSFKWKGYKLNGPANSDGSGGVMNYYNEKIGVAAVYFNFTTYIPDKKVDAEDKWSVIRPSSSKTYAETKVKALPRGDHLPILNKGTLNSDTLFNSLVMIEEDGTIKARKLIKTNNKNIHCSGFLTYLIESIR